MSEALIGKWLLQQCTINTKEGLTFKPYGDNPEGVLMYDNEGYMSVSLMQRDRPKIGVSMMMLLSWKFIVFHPLRYFLAINRLLKAAGKFTSYSGAYQVRDKQVQHHVQLAMIPDLIGQTLTREIELEGDQLRLIETTPHYLTTIVWQRFSNQTHS